MNKNLIYAGNNLFNKDFSLYGMEDLDCDATEENILSSFKLNCLETIKTRLLACGLMFKKLGWYHPMYYNFEGDNIDLTLSVVDKQKFKRLIVRHTAKINKALSNNKSYDGYMSLTVRGTFEELERLSKPNYEPDPLVLSTVLGFNFDFCIEDCYIFDDPEEV